MVFTSGALLSCEVSLRREDLLFIDGHIHLFDQKAVGRDSVTLLEKKDVAYDDVLDWDLGGDAVLAADDGGLLSLDLFNQVLELIFLAKVTDRRDQSHKKDGNID